MTRMENDQDLSSFVIHSDRIELADGRYLIYYTFSDTSSQHNNLPQNDSQEDGTGKK